MAISADGKNWFLVNASPDLRVQIEAFPGLHPSPESVRNSPIAAILLTNADLDHVLGLFLLRERSSLRVYAPKPIFEVVARDLRLVEILKPFCRVDWHNAPSDSPIEMTDENGKPSGLRLRALPLSTKRPPYATPSATDGTQSVAYEIVDERTGGRLLVAPDVASITPELRLALNVADAVLFDGTFWSNHEFQSITGKVRTADDMGHLTIRDGSLDILRALKARQKIYFHINNTNPVLNPDSAEYAEVVRAGLVVGYDGLEFEL